MVGTGWLGGTQPRVVLIPPAQCQSNRIIVAQRCMRRGIGRSGLFGRNRSERGVCGRRAENSTSQQNATFPRGQPGQVRAVTVWLV